MRNLKPHLLPLVIWTLAFLAIYGPLLVGLQGLPSSDTVDGMYPQAVALARAVHHGRLPLWSPGSYGGWPVAGDPQAATFYPPRWITVLLAPGGVLPVQGLLREALAHLWLAGAGMYLLATAMSGRREAGLLAAITWGLSGYLTGYPLHQLPVLETISWLPWALLCLHRAAQAERPARWLAAAAAALALCALAGHPQTLMQGAYLALAFFLHAAWRARWTWGAIARWGACLVLLSAAMAAPLWLPVLDYYPLTARAQVGYDYVRSGIPLQDAIQLLVPNSLTLWAPQYVGMGALLLLCLAWLRRSALPEARRSQVIFWGAAALITGLLALGDDGILFALGYRLLPGLALFRQQERWLGPVSLCLTLLAALGVDAWLGEALPAAWRAMRRVLMGVAVALLLAGGMLTVIAAGGRAQWVPLWLWAWALWGLCGLLLALPALTGERVGRPQALALLTLLAVVDLGAVATRVSGAVPAYTISHDAWRRVLQETGLADTAAAAGRLDSSQLLTANLGELYGLEEIWGVSPLQPQALLDLRSLPRERLYALLDVGLTLSATPPGDPAIPWLGPLPQGSLWLQRGPLYLHVNPGWHARAWLVQGVQPVPDAAAALAALADPALDPARTVVLEGDLAAQPPAEGSSGTVALQRPAPERMVLRAEAAAPAWLVLSEWQSRGLLGSGWRATLDGQRAPVLRANGGMMALALPAGEHRVELRYAAPAVWIGLALAALGLVGLAMICWRGGPPAWRRAEREAVTSPGVAAGLAEADAAESPAAAAERPWEVALEAWLQRSWPWVLAGLLVLGAALRLYHLGTQELRGDEAFSVLMAQGSPGTIIHNLLANGDPHSPLHYLLVHATLSVAGWGELALRLPSALLGLLAIPVFCWVGRQAGGRPWALLLALLAAGAQPLVWIGQDLRNQYVLAVLASAAATGLLLWQASGPPRRWRAAGWLAYALLLALTVYGFYYAGLALLGHGAYLLLHGERRRLWLPWCLAVALAVALFLPWALVAAPAVLASNQLKSPTAPALAPFVLESATYLTAGDGWARPWGRGIAALGLLLAGLGARRLWRRDRALAGASLLALLATGLALYLVRHLRSVYEPRYLLGSLLFWWVLLLSGLEGLWRSRRPGARWLGALLLAVLLAVNGVGVVRYHLAPAQPRTVGYRAAAAIIAAHAQPGDVFVRNAPDPCWDYYLRDLPMTRAMVPGEPLPEDDAIARALITLGQEHDRLWFVPGMNPEWDPEQRARHWLEYNMLRERLEPAGFFTVLAYRPPRSALRAMLADGSELESAITLEGYSLLLSGQPVDPAQPLALHEGDTLEVTLAWRPAQRLERDYTVFVHLLGQDGVLRTQHDGPPLLGTRPTTYWEAGELVLDRHTLQLPALEGEGATLHLGMYDSVTVERVPWRGGGDARIIPLRLAP